MATAILKTCSRCKQSVPATSFHADRRASDGLQPDCKTCSAAARRAKYHANAEAARAKQRAYYESNKEAVLACNARSRAKYPDKVKDGKRKWYESVKDDPEWLKKRDQRSLATKDQKREYDRAYRAANEERLKPIKQAWRAKNALTVRMIRFTYVAKRRAKVKAGDSSKKVRLWVEAQKKVCHWCRKKCPDDFHVDHIQPLARGGEHVTANMCIACPTCNVRKSARDPIEFAQSLGMLL